MFWNKIDIDLFGKMYLPTFMRTEELQEYCNSSASALVQLYDKTLYQMQHTGQVIYLEKVLNEFMNVLGYNTQNHLSTRKIYISDAPILPRNYIYRPEEQKPMYLNGTPIFLNRPEVQYHFIVNIPTSIIYDELILRNVIDYYKIAGKQYIIQTYEDN